MPQHLQVSKLFCTFAPDFRRETRKSLRKYCFILTDEVWKISLWQRETVVAFRDCMHLVSTNIIRRGALFLFCFLGGIPEPVSGRIRDNSPRFLYCQ